MTPTDELIAALRKAAQAIHIAVEKSVADDISQKLTEAADRLASLTAPVREWETTADERRSYVWALKNDININGPGVGDYTRIKFLAVLRDFDRLSSAIATKDYLLRLCEEQHHRDEAALAAERDQNKRLVDLLRLVNSASYSSDTHSFNEAMTAVADYLEPIFAAERAALAQPEEQR